MKGIWLLLLILVPVAGVGFYAYHYKWKLLNNTQTQGETLAEYIADNTLRGPFYPGASFTFEGTYTATPDDAGITLGQAIFWGNFCYQAGLTGQDVIDAGIMTTAQANQVSGQLTYWWNNGRVDLGTFEGWTGEDENQALGHSSTPPGFYTAADLVGLAGGIYKAFTGQPLTGSGPGS